MSFFLAMTFLTVIPLRRRAQTGGRAIGWAMFWFPVVGLLIGCAGAAVLFGAARIMPGQVPEIAAVVFLVALTGALHLDGLADTFDGLFGGRDREARLRIMRDHAVGAYGVAAVMCVLLLKVGLITALADRLWLSGQSPPDRCRWLIEWLGRPRWRQAAVVALMPVWGRWIMTLAAGVGPYARGREGTGAALVARMTVVRSCLLGTIPFGLTVALFGLPGLWMGVAVTLVGLGLLLWWRGKIGGVTGDTMGGLGELTEVVFLAAAVVILPITGTALPPY